MIEGNDIWEALFSIMKGDVPEELTDECLNKLAEHLNSAIAAMRGEPVGWQPIESAPRDGTAILAYGTMPGENARVNGWVCVRETKWRCYPKGSPGYARWESGDGPLGLGWDWYESVHNWAHTWSPTHWMPLPTPPNSEKDER